MAKYGSNRYGAGFKYGESTTVSVYYNSNISAWSYDYGTVRLSWDPITPDPTENSPTHWKLVKTYTGLPDNPDDGYVLAGGEYATFLTSYTDVNYANVGIEANYSIWVFNGDRWIYCGSDFAIIVGDRDSLTKLTSWLPKAWTNPINSVGEALGESESNTFMSLIAAYAFVYDKLRAEAALLGKADNRLYIPGALLKYRVQDFGFNYEPALGDSYHRSLFGAGNAINSYKGTALGISIYTTALTHWADDIITGHNLLLDYNDSSFEESVGHWTTSTGTFTSVKYSASSILPPTAVLYDRTFSPRVVSFGQLTVHTNADVTLKLPGTLYSPIKYGVPVKGNVRYLFSGWVTDLDAHAHVKAKIKWYDSFGELLETSLDGPEVQTSGSWQEFQTPSDSGRNGLLSPLKAAFATLEITLHPSSSSDNRYAFDFFQFAEADKSYEFEDARRIQVHVKGQKENYLTNPDFKEGTHSWKPLNGKLSSDSSTASALVLGTHAAKLTSDSNGTAAFVADWVPSEPGKVVTFSAYVLASAARSAVARIEFSNLASVDQQTTVLSDTNGLYYPTEINYIDSDSVDVDGTDLVRVQVTGIVPPYTRDAGISSVKGSIYFDDNIAGDTYWIDGVMLEEKDTPSYFYSGEGGVFPENPTTETFYNSEDCFWEIKNIYNYTSNPSFQVNTTDWTAVSGTLTRVATDGSYTPLYGTHFGKLTYSSSGSVSFTSYLDTAAVGGEDVTVSVYVRGAVGTYTIGGSSFAIDSDNYLYWVRISDTIQLTAGQTTVNTTISFTNASGSTSTYFHLDGAQVERGRVVSSFVDPQAANSAVVTIANPLSPTKNMYLTQGESVGGGTSSYFNNYKTKIARLTNTLPLVMPFGSTWCIKTGAVSEGYADLTESLILSSSFENDLGNWNGINATLTRAISQGSLFEDTLTHGQAYCAVSSSTANTFGIKVSEVYLTPNGGYYASVAIRPEADAYGDYTLTVRFFDANDSEIIVYTDNVTGQYTTSSLDQLGAPNVETTDEARTKTITIEDDSRWAYLANTFPVSSITGAAYANISVEFSSITGYSVGQTFHIDRCVFRQ